MLADITGFPQATVDALVSQNKNLQAELTRLLHQNRALEADLETARRKVIELDIIDKEREAEFKNIQDSLKSTKSENFTLSRDRDSAEKQLALTLEEFESAKAQFAKISKQAAKYRRLYFSIKKRIRTRVRKAWNELKSEKTLIAEKQQRLQTKTGELKKNLEEMTSYIQKRNQEYQNELEANQETFQSKLKKLESESGSLKKEVEHLSTANATLEEKNKVLRSKIIQLENSALKRNREINDNSKDLLDRYESGQSRIFALMTENKDLKEKIKRLENNASRLHAEAEEARDKWAKEKVEMTHAKERLINTEASLKLAKENTIDADSIEGIRMSLHQLEQALNSVLIPDGQNESFTDISIKTEETAHDILKEDPTPDISKEPDPFRSIDEDLLRISSYMS